MVSNSHNVLLVAAKANMIQQFNLRNIELLQKIGYTVHVATDYIDFGSMDREENTKLITYLHSHGVIMHQVDFGRGFGQFISNLKSIIQLNYVVSETKFDFMHVHSPIGAALGRIVSLSRNIPVMYTAHGFHFFKGSPLKNWIVFPIEWFLSFNTKWLITINHQDFELAQKMLHAEKVTYLPGVGVPVHDAILISKDVRQSIRHRYRSQFNLSDDVLVVSTIGELSVRKNQQLVLKALSKVKSIVDFRYFIVGVGDEYEELIKLADSLGILEKVMFLGYRTDLRELHYMSDLNVFPSLREGLGLAGLEAISDGDYLLGANNNGIRDYMLSSDFAMGFDPNDVDDLSEKILQFYENKKVPSIENYEDKLLEFDSKNVDRIMDHNYREMEESVNE